MAEPVSLAEQIVKLKRDVETWRKHVEKLEKENAEMGAKYVQQSTELMKVKDSVVLMEELRTQRDGAVGWLTTILEHVAGRDGALAKSKLFCDACKNAHTCPTREANIFIHPFLETAQEKLAS